MASSECGVRNGSLCVRTWLWGSALHTDKLRLILSSFRAKTWSWSADRSGRFTTCLIWGPYGIGFGLECTFCSWRRAGEYGGVTRLVGR